MIRTWGEELLERRAMFGGGNAQSTLAHDVALEVPEGWDDESDDRGNEILRASRLAIEALLMENTSRVDPSTTRFLRTVAEDIRGLREMGFANASERSLRGTKFLLMSAISKMRKADISIHRIEELRRFIKTINKLIKRGGGLSDIFGKLAAKATGETAKKLAMKGAEKAAEQIGSKTGQAIGEKIHSGITGNKGGMMIQKLLRKRGGSRPSKLSNEFDDILANF